MGVQLSSVQKHLYETQRVVQDMERKMVDMQKHQQMQQQQILHQQ